MFELERNYWICRSVYQSLTLLILLHSTFTRLILARNTWIMTWKQTVGGTGGGVNLFSRFKMVLSFCAHISNVLLLKRKAVLNKWFVNCSWRKNTVKIWQKKSKNFICNVQGHKITWSCLSPILKCFEHFFFFSAVALTF